MIATTSKRSILSAGPVARCDHQRSLWRTKVLRWNPNLLHVRSSLTTASQFQYFVTIARWEHSWNYNNPTMVQPDFFSVKFRYSIRCYSTNDDNTRDEKKQLPSQHHAKQQTTTTSSDPPIWTTLVQIMPPTWIPYARLARMDKPIGTMLLVCV